MHRYSLFNYGYFKAEKSLLHSNLNIDIKIMELGIILTWCFRFISDQEAVIRFQPKGRILSDALACMLLWQELFYNICFLNDVI